MVLEFYVAKIIQRDAGYLLVLAVKLLLTLNQDRKVRLDALRAFCWLRLLASLLPA